MSAFAQAAERRRLDPANDTHYAISEEDELRLRLVAEAAETMGRVLEGFDPEKSEVPETALASLFYTLSFAINGAIEPRVVVFPKRGRGK